MKNQKVHKKRKMLSKRKKDMAIIGAGYVGLVSGACFADIKRSVVLVEKNKDRVERLKRGIMPFHEPGLEEMVVRNQQKGRLSFTNQISHAAKQTDMFVVAVGTPTLPNGNVDMRDYWSVIDEIGKSASGHTIIVNKSTVPIGTARKAIAYLQKHHKHAQFDVVSFPEFLREGNAISDFLYPDRLVVGTESKKAEKVLRQLLQPIRTKKVFTGIETAEMVKYASNAFLATKISFINEIANVCETVGADVTQVALGMGLDKRIGKHFLQAGIGYGGSCFPKDVKALKHIAGNHNYKFRLLKAVIEVNTSQKKRILEKLQKHLGSLRGKTISVLGLAFKNNTDDVRESAAIVIIKQLLQKGATVIAHDPIAEENAKHVLQVDGKLIYCDSAEQAVIDTDAVIIATEWQEFTSANWKEMKTTMKNPLIIDGRNLLDKNKMKTLGFHYYAVGR